ncbi:hypothetical protein CHS0354_008181 [Potamilus streckersoni]|uniref:lysoplasmalogenase n=1 Tax=Potamilus streckersoni TaxID=2493646 RepID=A0AAE0RWF1_9BIVA|nr:hypothetical protein CHS0354_008181 [Potamilus streckersoni]
MTKPLTVLKSVGPKLVPFFKTVAIFFVLFGDTDSEQTSSPLFFCVVKCLPIISLILFVLLHGMNLTEYYRYSRRILIGLIFSCMGDICLVWKKSYFLVGMGMFAIAHIEYARAFGWRPFNPYAGSVVAALGSLVYLYLQPGLHGIMVHVTAVYIALICIMAWRGIARVQFFDELWTWTKLCSCVGAILFVISDTIIAINMFRFEIPYAHPLIMLTYYAAQFGIALSVVDSQVDELLRKTPHMAQNGHMD